MNDDMEHQRLRELLGAYVLGHLDAPEVEQVKAHLDGCAGCRRIRDEIAPLAARLDALDPAVFDSPPSPPVGLGAAIRDRIVAERADLEAPRAGDVHDVPRSLVQVGRPRRSRFRLAAAAAVLVVAGLGVGAGIGRATAPQGPTVPMEPISLAVADDEPVTIDSANLVAHTWGVELRLAGEGFTEGDTFRASFRTLTGALVPAGEFRGTGGATMTCNLQSAVLRDQVSEVVVTDESGRAVLTAPL